MSSFVKAFISVSMKRSLHWNWHRFHTNVVLKGASFCLKPCFSHPWRSGQLRDYPKICLGHFPEQLVVWNFATFNVFIEATLGEEKRPACLCGAGAQWSPNPQRSKNQQTHDARQSGRSVTLFARAGSNRHDGISGTLRRAGPDRPFTFVTIVFSTETECCVSAAGAPKANVFKNDFLRC